MADFDPDKYLEKKKKSEPFDPDKYLASTKPESALQTFGRSSASLADTALNAITGTLDYAAYPLARAFGRSPEQAQQETTSPKDVVGRMFGVTGTPGYENAPLRSIGRNLGETISENVVQPVSSATGLPEQDVANMLTSATMGVAPVVPKVVKPVVQATKTAGEFATQVPGGMLGRATGYIAKPGEAPAGYQVPSSRIPLTETFTKPEDWAKFQHGELPYGQFPPETPIQQLPTNAMERTALKLSGGEIPASGQAGRAFGERLGETYRNPITAAIDVGSLFATGGVPVLTTARGALAGVQGLADFWLSRKGFDPNLPKQMEMYRSGQMPMPGTPPAPGPVAPTNYPMTVAGPNQQLTPSVIPMPAPQRNVRVEGQSYNLPYQIDTSQVQTARAPQSAVPVPDLAQLAAQRSAQEAAKSANQVRQTAAQQAQSMFAGKPNTTPPATVQPKTRPSNEIREELTKLDRRNDELFNNTVHERSLFDPPELKAMREEKSALYPKIKALEAELKEALSTEQAAAKAAKRAETRAINAAKKKAPSNVSQMLIDDKQLPTGISSLSKEAVGEIYSNKSAYDKAMLFKTLEENVPTASYIEGDKLITVYPQNIPKDLMKKAGINPMATIIRDVKTGKVIKD